MSGQTQPETALQALAEKLRTDAIAIFGEGQAERDIIEWFYGALLAAAPSTPAAQGAVPEGFRVMRPTSAVVRDGERWEIYAPCGSGGIIHEDEVADWVVRKLLDALAAAPAHPAERQEQEPVAWTSRAKLKAMNDMGVASMWPKRIADDNDVPLYTDAPAARQAQEDLHVWRATTRFGETCHFGEASTARAWAGENGTVERVDLTPVPELRVVERQDQGEVQRLREALEAIADCTDDDQARNCALIALAASTGQEVE